MLPQRFWVFQKSIVLERKVLNSNHKLAFLVLFINMDFFQNICFKKSNDMAVEISW